MYYFSCSPEFGASSGEKNQGKLRESSGQNQPLLHPPAHPSSGLRTKKGNSVCPDSSQTTRLVSHQPAWGDVITRCIFSDTRVDPAILSTSDHNCSKIADNPHDDGGGANGKAATLVLTNWMSFWYAFKVDSLFSCVLFVQILSPDILLLSISQESHPSVRKFRTKRLCQDAQRPGVETHGPRRLRTLHSP